MSESPQRLITYFSDKAKAPRWVWAPNPQWSPRKRERLPADKEMTPGPIYSPRHQGQRTAWQFGTSNREWDHLPRDFWPQLAPGAAPDQYSIKAPKQRPLSFARGPNRVDFEIPDTPGPGHRSTDIAVERPRHPAYSMGSKPQFLWSTYAPGRPARGASDVSETPGPGAFNAGTPRALTPRTPKTPRTPTVVRRPAFPEPTSPGPGHYEQRGGFKCEASPRRPGSSMTRRPNCPESGPQCPVYTQFDSSR